MVDLHKTGLLWCFVVLDGYNVPQQHRACISGNEKVWIGGGMVIAALIAMRHFMRQKTDQNDH